MAKEVFIVITDVDDSSMEWQEALVKSTAVCPNYKTAYHIGTSLSLIKQPASSYRVSLEKIKQSGAVKVEGEERKSFTIVKTKFIKYF